MSSDWTCGPTGTANTSETFDRLVREVERLIRSDAHMLISGNARSTARLILANLAHTHGLAPQKEAATVEWRLCSDGFSTPHHRVVSEEEAKRIMRDGIFHGSMNGLWLERREVTDWERVHG